MSWGTGFDVSEVRSKSARKERKRDGDTKIDTVRQRREAGDFFLGTPAPPPPLTRRHTTIATAAFFPRFFFRQNERSSQLSSPSLLHECMGQKQGQKRTHCSGLTHRHSEKERQENRDFFFIGKKKLCLLFFSFRRSVTRSFFISPAPIRSRRSSCAADKDGRR